jgi:catechol 2,3-dioxygenase-like lactoylglutathione lyase family enzyme
VPAAVAFSTERWGVRLDRTPAPGFASLSRGALRLLLNQPGAGGAGQATPDGHAPTPGGWNRIQLEVADLPVTIERRRGAGCRFRNDLVTGRGGRQILLEDPSGNLVERFKPA